MEEIQNIVTHERAEEILHDIEQWHEEYIVKNLIESDEMKEKILNIKIQNILFNLQKNSEISGNMCSQKSFEMIPERWREMMQLQEYQDNRVEDQVTVTDMFQCGRCNSKRCTYFSLQLRSGDEGESQFINCLDCNKRWKQ